MRGTLLLLCTAAGLAAAVACASSEDNPPLPADPDSGTPPLPDATTPTEDARPDVVPHVLNCSAAGWCVTPFPDKDLMFKDIWPLEGRAFAIAESFTLGVRVLEWEEARGTWQYIDDNSQNESGMGKYAGRIWAPNANEVYYGVAPGTIQHGKRTPPATEFTWEHHALKDNSPDTDSKHDHGFPYNGTREDGYPALGVWGIGSDVYAWYANTIFQWKSVDGGPPGWVAQHIMAEVDDPEEHVFFLGAAGTSADDVWFSGNREFGSACAVIVRKTPAGFKVIADGITADRCPPRREGQLEVTGNKGWFTDLVALPGGRFLGLKGAGSVVHFAPDNDTWTLNTAWVPPELTRRGLFSLYAATEERPWMSGIGLVVTSNDAWDSGVFTLSTLSLNGGPIDRPLYQVRGTSNTNLWAVGVRYALHKTTP